VTYSPNCNLHNFAEGFTFCNKRIEIRQNCHYNLQLRNCKISTTNYNVKQTATTQPCMGKWCVVELLLWPLWSAQQSMGPSFRKQAVLGRQCLQIDRPSCLRCLLCISWVTCIHACVFTGPIPQKQFARKGSDTKCSVLLRTRCCHFERNSCSNANAFKCSKPTHSSITADSRRYGVETFHAKTIHRILVAWKVICFLPGEFLACVVTHAPFLASSWSLAGLRHMFADGYNP